MPRPPKSTKTKKIQLSAYATPDYVAQIKLIAESKNHTVSSLIIAALDAYIATDKDPETTEPIEPVTKPANNPITTITPITPDEPAALPIAPITHDEPDYYDDPDEPIDYNDPDPPDYYGEESGSDDDEDDLYDDPDEYDPPHALLMPKIIM